MPSPAAPVPVVLVHGLRGSAVEWMPVQQQLEEHGHTVVVVDLPGHGIRTDEPFSIGESLVTIAEAVAELNSSPVLIGHGLGAHLAIEFASVVPEMKGVVAIGCGTQALGWWLDSYRIASGTHTLLPDKGAAMSSAASQTFVRSTLTETVATTEHFDDTLRQLDALDTRGALSRLDAPVWLLNGSWDRFRLQERSFLESSASATLIRQHGVRLAARISRPIETTRLLVGILDGVDANR
jgi:pimeloyl-ACP methyl ester carboxylesterase